MNISFIVPDRRLKIYPDKENILELILSRYFSKNKFFLNKNLSKLCCR